MRTTITVVMLLVTVLVAMFFLCGCTTTMPHKSEVMERMGNVSDTPKWTYGADAMISEGADVVFIRTMTMSGNARPEACIGAAELDAKATLIQHIQTNITTSGQLDDPSVVNDPSYESLTAFLAQGKLHGVRTVEKYYEKRIEYETVTDRVIKMHCAVKVAIKKADLERQLQAAMGNGGNKEIREKLLQAQEQFIENVK